MKKALPLSLSLAAVGLLLTAAAPTSAASAADLGSAAALQSADTATPEIGLNIASLVCVDTGAKCGPYGDAWVSVGPRTIYVPPYVYARVCVTSNTAHILC